MKKKKMKTKALTLLQQRFIAEYLVDLNATQAATRAGYSKRTAYSAGQRLLKNVQILQEIARRKQRQINKIELTAERILLEMARIALLDARALFDVDGHLLPIADLDDNIAACIASIDVVKRIAVSTDEVEEYTHKIRLYDKNTALTNLARHFKLLKEYVPYSEDDREEVRDQVLRLLAELAAEHS